MSKKQQSNDTIYEFVGSGLGVPGLPHRLSLAEAEAAGTLKLLQAAIAAGVYQIAAEAVEKE